MYIGIVLYVMRTQCAGINGGESVNFSVEIGLVVTFLIKLTFQIG